VGYAWDFATVLRHWPILARGLLTTVQLAAVSLALGLAAGLVLGAARYSRARLVHWPATAWVEVFRDTPVLVQIMWFFFAFPIISPFEVSAYTAAVLALSLNTSAFAAEIFRAGIQSIATGQWDAARALGMTYGQQMRRVILPQAVRRMLPAFTNRALELLKMTSLASAIAVPELLYGAKTIATAYFNPIEAFTTVALIYFAVAYPMTQLVHAVERALRRHD
jgi:polar amino acid transport system permease protein